ncbi:MAG: ABC transporter ATP-binding protein [Candidatus Thermoplasmatota archaeon]|nr:ABC transporter ATP-binding protein [Euryarchaeota archaeon]MBU4033100.1 ABC transporter ATP-binding protein [Candidatus Thermoplasmatota archaeon]MBU4072339.1 ABC transporter ATP-binding protein [Candidatus Thermoplasmatota archaeon]MBU4143629.1 ABC transporter ATP-binding protein [Candidatus Thermoplasmatota archaeon]MBU4591289.1 ABC transporter ATP-binding protein [Candidatus Thermoplasmatota archaeon]
MNQIHEPAIVAKGISKTYEKKTQALKDMNLTVNKGEVFTILGPNGAGKTTFLRILCTQLMPTSGDAHILGYSVVNEPNAIREKIAMVPQDAMAYANFTPWDYAYNFCLLRGMDKAKAKKNAEEALRAMLMWDMRLKPCQSMSGGEKRRALIAATLASDAPIMMLDEPTSGLDAIGRRNVWSTLRDRAAKGNTIILTTHMMDEAEMVSDRLAIINKGELVIVGTTAEIKKQVPYRYRVIAPEGEIDQSKYPEVTKIGDRLVVYLKSDDDAIELVRDMLKRGVQAEAAPVTLEDAFVRLAGGELE